MRNRILGVVAAVLTVIGFGATAQAYTLSATSGGLSAITVSPGGTFVVDFRINFDGVPSRGYGFEAAWDGGVLPLLTVANPLLDNTGDIFEEDPVGPMNNLTPSAVEFYIPSAASVVGHIDDFEAIRFTGSQTFNGIVGHVTFTALLNTGVTTVFPRFSLGDGVVTSTGSTTQVATLNALTVTVPEPATAGILALGLLGLAAAGRRMRG